jgi:hypothetical protein
MANHRAFNQLESFPWNTPRWHPVCSLIVHLKDWLPGVAGTDPRLGYRFGASITKRGLAPAPFFISIAALFFPAKNRACPMAFHQCGPSKGMVPTLNCIRRPNPKDPASAVTVHAAGSVSLTQNRPLRTVNQKNERPLGGATARAWDGGNVIRSLLGLSDR